MSFLMRAGGLELIRLFIATNTFSVSQGHIQQGSCHSRILKPFRLVNILGVFLVLPICSHLRKHNEVDLCGFPFPVERCCANIWREKRFSPDTRITARCIRGELTTAGQLMGYLMCSHQLMVSCMVTDIETVGSRC